MQQYLLSIDIESVGDHFNNSVIAIGACFGPADGSWPRNQLIKRRWNLKPLPGDVEDPDCMAEFWSKNLEVYNEIKSKDKDVHEVMNELQTFCLQLVANYEDNPAFQGKIKIVTDCPDFDLGRLHYLGEVATKTWSHGIRSLGKPGKRHSQVDPIERLDALNAREACDKWIQRNAPGVVHDHRPENDAEHSYYQMVFLNRKGEDL